MPKYDLVLFNLLFDFERALNYQTPQGDKYFNKEDRIAYKLYLYGGWREKSIAEFFKMSFPKISNLILEIKGILWFYHGYNINDVALLLKFTEKYEFERVIELVKRGLKRRKIGQELQGKWKGIMNTVELIKRTPEALDGIALSRCKNSRAITHKEIITYMTLTRNNNRENVLERLDDCNHCLFLIISGIIGDKLLEEYIINPNSLCKRQRMFIREHLYKCKICKAHFNAIKRMERKVKHPKIEYYFNPKATEKERNQIMQHVIRCHRCAVLWAREMRIGPCPSEEELREAIVNPRVMEKLRPHIQKCPSCEAAIGLTLFEETWEIGVIAASLPQKIENQGVTAVIKRNKKKELVVSISSKKYNLNDVDVSLCEKRGKRLWNEHKSASLKNNKANLGILKELGQIKDCVLVLKNFKDAEKIYREMREKTKITFLPLIDIMMKVVKKGKEVYRSIGFPKDQLVIETASTKAKLKKWPLLIIYRRGEARVVLKFDVSFLDLVVEPIEISGLAKTNVFLFFRNKKFPLKMGKIETIGRKERLGLNLTHPEIIAALKRDARVYCSTK